MIDAKSVTSVAERSSEKPKRRPRKKLNIAKYLQDVEHPCTAEEKTADGAMRYAMRCPFENHHDDCGSHAALYQRKDGRILFDCFSPKCEGRTWPDVVGVLGEPKGGHKAGGDSGGSRAATASDDPHRLAVEFLEQRYSINDQPVLRYYQEDFYLYDAGIYRLKSNDDLKKHISSFIAAQGVTATQFATSNMREALAATVLVPAEAELPVWTKTKREEGISWITVVDDARSGHLVFRNGVLNIDEQLNGGPNALQPLSPDLFCLTGLPYDFEPQATAPKWQAFLDQVLEGDTERIALLQEWFGYCLRPGNAYQKFLVMVGGGSNGKLVVTSVLTELVGRENVSSVAIEDFGRNFGLAPMLGKLVNVGPDMEQVEKVQEGRLKAMTGGDQIMVDRKFREPVPLYPAPKLVFSTNVLPPFRDTSDGIWRRVIIMPFNYHVPADERDPRLADKIIGSELSGIVNWALDGLARLQQQRRFSRSGAVEEATQGHREDCDPIRDFLEDCCVLDPSADVESLTLYREYQQWCERTGHRPFNDSSFGRRLRSQAPIERKQLRVDGRRVRRYVGVRLSAGVGASPFAIGQGLAANCQ